jgi:hypothetical protein
MHIDKILLAIFFLYFTLISGVSSDLLNCGLQRFIQQNKYFKHIILFSSIFVFTFILNWYTFNSLVLEDYETDGIRDEKTQAKKKSKSGPFMARSLIYSMLAYFIFLITSKCEGVYLSAFFILSLIVLCIQVYIKAENKDLFESLEDYFFVDSKSASTLNADHKLKQNDEYYLIQIFNLTRLIYFVILAMLLYGTLRYYQRQRMEHIKNWSLIDFWLGPQKNCAKNI